MRIRIFGKIDSLLGRVTMYRLALYYLLFLVAYGMALCFFGVLPWRAEDLLVSAAVLTVVSWGTNKILARIFRADENIESSLITGLILALLINPDPALQSSSLIFWGFAGLSASASKYLFAPFKKHIFNPAAFAVFATGSVASWWVGLFPAMLPPVFIGGLIVARKLRAGGQVLSFLGVSLAMIYWKGGLTAIPQTFYYAPFFFFAFIMLTEPATSPSKKSFRALYGALVGFLSAFTQYETALIIGNIFSYIASFKYGLTLNLKEKKLIASAETYEFSFVPSRKINFQPGQYLEWALKHRGADSRGVRRFFTIASSPTETEIKLGTKFYPGGSTFKKALIRLLPGAKLSAGRLAGDFTMPEDKSKKLVFIAGGIGITPFRSMVKYLIDMNEKRDIVLLYSNKTESEIAYRNIFEEARVKKLGIKTVYISNDKDGLVTDKTIMKETPDFKERYFYISGPYAMVNAFEKTLSKMGVSGTHIKTDFFPGYA